MSDPIRIEFEKYKRGIYNEDNLIRIIEEKIENKAEAAWMKSWETCENYFNQKFGTEIMLKEKQILEYFGMFKNYKTCEDYDT